MQKKHIITLAGNPGSGKSSTSKLVASMLGFEHFSSGDLFRQIGSEQGKDVLETNLQAEKGLSNVDYLVDQKLRDIYNEQDNLVIDSRMAWHWMPDAFKVYVTLDMEIAARRIIDNTDEARREVELIPDDPKEYAQQLQARLDSEARRYESLYGVNPYDDSNHDLVIDTSKYPIEEVAQQVVDAYNAWLVS